MQSPAQSESEQRGSGPQRGATSRVTVREAVLRFVTAHDTCDE